MFPQVGMEGGTPMPKKVNDASERIAEPISIVARIIAESITDGRMCLNRIRPSLQPMVVEARINSRSRTESTCARTVRV